jgi:hypothetical protein
MHCPLYSLILGDLSSDVYQIERLLSRTLATWNAILLIDECDVFLEAWETHDLARKYSISTFLKTLEYYEGILFMTTNRADNIDPASQSGIHIFLQYPDFSNDSRSDLGTFPRII